MKTKKHMAIFSIPLLLLFALFCIDLVALRGTYDGLFFAAPVLSGETDIPVEKLEDHNGDTLLLTYEVFRAERIGALNSHDDVTMIGTNYTYPHVMRLPVIRGGFFTQTAQERQNRSVTLNRKAAFALFGGVDVQGLTITWNRETYIVTGVVDDGSDSSHVYLPASFLGGTAGPLLSQSNASGAEVKNAYKKIGIDDTHYTLTDLRSVRESIRLKWIGAAALGLSAILAFALRSSLRAGIRFFHEIKALFADHYINQIIKTHKALLHRAALACFAAALCAAALLMLSVNLFGMMLDWQNDGQMPSDVPAHLFGGKIQELYQLVIWSDVLFIAFVTGVVFAVTAKIPLVKKIRA